MGILKRWVVEQAELGFSSSSQVRLHNFEAASHEVANRLEASRSLARSCLYVGHPESVTAWGPPHAAHFLLVAVQVWGLCSAVQNPQACLFGQRL